MDTARKRKSITQQSKQHRIIGWKISWEDLNWPDQDIEDKIKRRADAAADAAVTLAIVFGAHFRWDFIPLWSRLHEMFAYTAEQLHQRGIKFFDHHSSVVVNRPRNAEEAWEIWHRNRGHLSFYPSIEALAEWRFEGQSLNDWRMIDVATGQPVRLPDYTAEQFCPNNPGFRKAYQSYVRKLVKESNIDGLMSDDAIFYPEWNGCGCKWCRERFKKEYGHDLPPITDKSFWGNRDSEAFKDWIEMRYRTTSDFLGAVKEVVGQSFPLLSCCSSSEFHESPCLGMTYQEFIKSCNMVMLEMCGATPELDGTWDGRISSQLLQLAVARDAGDVPCIGIGYALSPETAMFVWAINRFLGSQPWAAVMGRLGLPDSTIKTLVMDESAMVKDCYRWEEEHEFLFEGEADADVAVLFSRSTRDYYGQTREDYSGDYQLTCRELMKGHVNFEVVTLIPDKNRWPVLVLSSVICLSDEEREQLDAFLDVGGTVVATGPLGLLDERARPVSDPWLKQHGIDVSVNEPERKAGFPPYMSQAKVVPECQGSYQSKKISPAAWVRISAGKGTLLWSPGRVQTHATELALAAQVTPCLPRKNIDVETSPDGWYLRRFRAGNRLIFHALPATVEPVFHKTLEYQKPPPNPPLPIVEKINYTKPSPAQLLIRITDDRTSARVYSPDLPQPRSAVKDSRNGMFLKADLEDICRYFILVVDKK